MYELISVTDKCRYLNCPTRVGVVQTGEKEAVLIDAGGDKDAGKKLLKAVRGCGLEPAAIFATHSHADHIGGNRYLQDQTGCRIYASGLECAFTNHPILEPVMLYGGLPLPELQHKFLLAQESRAELLTQAVLPEGWKLLPLPGHSFDMVGFETDENVVFLGDCLCAKETLEKYGVSYLTDVAAYLQTLEQVKTMQARCFIPAHAEAATDIAPLAQYNIDAVLAIGETIVRLCEEPIVFETLLQKLFAAYNMTMNAQQYVLIGSTLRSYLTWLHKEGRVDFTFEDNRMLWKKA